MPDHEFQISMPAGSTPEQIQAALAAAGVPFGAGVRTELSAVLTRADGTIVDLGVLGRSDWGVWQRFRNNLRLWWLQRRHRRK